MKKVAERGVFNVVFVTNKEIQELNRQWRNKDAPTDVLSFPMDSEEPPDGEPWELGDVIISVERADEQADDYGHSLERELCFLFVHGALHVLGFDHETKKEEKEMFSRQDAVLESLGISRKK
ncbi:MAG: rRNA maturation RNase YbeY [Candidatus Melainabacteria bacterium]|nr:rRNA maturation RNase YbeY [Candidatus Melainabacteria bacterium]